MPLPSLLTQHIVRRPQRIALLQHIVEQGSITRAAKSAGMSYKAAWDAIDELNNLAASPLVERAVGGKGGGGARLSEEGLRVLQLYQRLQVLQAQVLEAAEHASDLDLLGRMMLRTSARNQLHGRIGQVVAMGRNDRIELDLGAGLFLDAQITHESTLALELAAGSEVFALIKAGWIELLHSVDQAPEGYNLFKGRVEQVLDEEEGPAELRLRLVNGQTLCALVEPSRLQGLKEGDEAVVGFAPTFVLIATPV
ncbi:TOBE domain-containing protein [Pseudomonas sp. dw_358]|uniref:TOBE domain-containing protein n=1 Tax=Pseudomonas sp. dw_358 TaxID=2720083 RepID=UPI001BD23C91|nr:TOBE domain-containing protein [Pseudomonas sp. dw_358]